MSDKLFRKLKCKKCKIYYKAKFSNEELTVKYPYKANDRSLKNLQQINKFMNAKRIMVCPQCGYETKISKMLLIKISRLNARRKGK